MSDSDNPTRYDAIEHDYNGNKHDYNGNTIVYVMKYGKLYVGPCLDGRWREDEYISNDGKTYLEKAMCTGEHDMSPRHDKQDHYNGADCPCCYLNITHTRDEHHRAAAKCCYRCEMKGKS